MMAYAKKVVSYFKKIKLRKYNNILEAHRWSRLIRRLSGTVVFEVVADPAGSDVIKSKFTKLGFLCFVLWNSAYMYCAYQAHIRDQTIIRSLYKTKLQRYGDDFEIIMSSCYVLFSLIYIPFKVSGNTNHIKKIVDVDKAIENIGEIIDYNKISTRAVVVSIGQIGVDFFRLFCIWMALQHRSNVTMPMEKMFVVIYSDAQAIIISSIFIFYMIIVRDRLRIINRALGSIKQRNCWGFKVFMRDKIPTNMVKVAEMRDRQVCDKIRACARVYSMLYKTSETLANLFGFPLLLTMFHYLNILILYLFYFMEATATGLFHDVDRYIDFVIYSLWEIVISVSTMFIIVYFCESTVKEAKHTSFIIHEIMNENFSAGINKEVIQFSLQLLHEKIYFTVLGLFDLNYALLQQGARSVSTYLVILLQFVTENNEGEL